MFDKIVTKTLRTISFAMFFVMIIVVFAQVLIRYFTDTSIAWSDELARLLLVWMSFLGVTLVHYSDAGHPAVTFLVDKIPAGARKYVDAAINVCMIFCFIVVFRASLSYTISNHSFVSPVLHYPNSIKYAVLPLSMLLMTIKSIQRAVDDIKTIVKKS